VVGTVSRRGAWGKEGRREQESKKGQVRGEGTTLTQMLRRVHRGERTLFDVMCLKR
jgi:hypothetical protein